MGNQRLDKVLSNQGYGTRKEIKKIIRDGAVQVDEKIVSDPGMHVDPETQKLYVNGRQVFYRNYIYLMMNKPQGVISATEDERERTVLDLLPEEYASFKPAPAGRLDKDTTGLLILTNDGRLAHDIISPKKHMPKIYHARVKGEVTKQDVDRFSEGIVLDDGYKTLPSRLSIMERGQISAVEIEIYEGKYHQIKRMFEAVGKAVVFLTRVSVGPVMLDENLKPGEFRELKAEEIQSLYHNI